jgi:replication factor A2
MAAYSAGGQTTLAESANYAHLPVLERTILECIQSGPKREDGINVEYIVKRVCSASVSANDLSYVVHFFSYVNCSL